MTWTSAAIAARVLHADDRVLVIDKPTGLPVHAGTKIQDHLEMFLDLLVPPGGDPPRLAHRLDKDTSGCLVLGRTAEAAAALGRAFLTRRVAKTYLAVVAGRPAAVAGTVEAPLRKVAGPTGALVVTDALGKPAATRWEVLHATADRALVRLEPLTGRMHQLRAHMAILGHPILGDPIYGPERPAPVPLHLHARRIALPPPFDVDATAPPPPHMTATLRAMGGPDPDTPSKSPGGGPTSWTIAFRETDP